MCSHSNIKGQNVAFKKTLSPCISYITNIKDEWPSVKEDSHTKLNAQLEGFVPKEKKLPLFGNIFGFSKENKQKEDNKKWFLLSKVIPPFIYLWTKQDSNTTKVILLTCYNTWSTILIADYIYSTNLVNYEFRLCRPGAYSVNVLGVSLITMFNEGAFLMSFPLAINTHTNLSHP